jgi:hypothetical protein
MVPTRMSSGLLVETPGWQFGWNEERLLSASCMFFELNLL